MIKTEDAARMKAGSPTQTRVRCLLHKAMYLAVNASLPEKLIPAGSTLPRVTEVHIGFGV